MLAHQPGNFISSGTGVKNDAVAGFDQLHGGFCDATLHRRIQRAFIFDRGFGRWRIAITDKCAAVGTHRNALLLQESQIVTDRYR